MKNAAVSPPGDDVDPTAEVDPTADVDSTAEVDPTAEEERIAQDSESEVQSLSTAEQPAASDPDSAETPSPACERCKELEEELEQSENKALRLHADLANYKRKDLDRRREAVEQNEVDLLRQLLPALDALDAAFAHHPEVVEPLRVAFLNPLQKVGLEVISAEGQDFDPAYHEAVSLEETDGAEREVVSEVFHSGYIWNGRVLRAAQVRVER